MPYLPEGGLAEASPVTFPTFSIDEEEGSGGSSSSSSGSAPAPVPVPTAVEGRSESVSSEPGVGEAPALPPPAGPPPDDEAVPPPPAPPEDAESREQRLRRIAKSREHYLCHFPKNPLLPNLQRRQDV